MNYNTLVEMHKGIIYLFLTVYIIKVILLFVNANLFEKVKAKTKIIEMILGPLVLLSGIWLLIELGGVPYSWLHVKITAVLVAIPLSIIGLKKSNKILAVLALVLFFYAYMAAKNKSYTLSSVTPKTDSQMLISGNPAITFNQNCCSKIHGSAMTISNLNDNHKWIEIASQRIMEN